MTNEKNMSIEARIAQELKADRLGALLTEDELQKLVREAIEGVISVRRRVLVPSKNHWEPAKETDAPLTIIHETAIEYLKPQIESITKDFLADDKVKTAIADAMTAALPAMLTTVMYDELRSMYQHGMSNVSLNTQVHAIDAIRNMLRQRGISI